MHRLLEIWDGTNRTELDRLVARLAREEASAQGLDAALVEGQLRQVAETFWHGELAHRLVSRKRLGREIPILLREADGRRYRGSIDLLYEDDDGTVVVADYKSDDETREAALRERYAEQLRRYAQAAQKALALKRRPRCELWMLRSGRRIVLDQGGSV
jgi:ATP-dependent helicase/nuclease subunit A